ncbi:MAG: Gfo/Idh/MocA family oxidoreductase [Alphaproteobacteria bacterium]
MKIGIIGAGHWGSNLIRNYAEMGYLSAVCDQDHKLLQQVSKIYSKVALYQDPNEFLKDRHVDAVVIATPPISHYSLAKMMLLAGKPTFVEKPLCLCVAEAEELVALAAERSLPLMVGHLLHYHPAFKALQNLLDSGKLGQLRYIYSHRLALGKVRREENALWSFAPHDISMVLALTQNMPQSVTAHGSSFITPNIADTTISYLNFPYGVRAHIFVSWLHPYKDQRFVVVGSEGMAVFDDVQPPEAKLLLYSHKVDVTYGLPTVQRAEATPIPLAWSEPLRSECEAFIEFAHRGKIPPSTGAEGLRVLRVLTMLQQSLDNT